ncbi:MAG TPA: glycosyltransferase N-terminal domain-containing protein [Gemmatimonadales bacterium]|nr:glycosyltransferase N-terminal domain-containing protein [Gemmatimonadales bacterium]
MPPRPAWGYRLAAAAAARAAGLAAGFNDKLARGLAGRRGLSERYAAWGAAQRDTRRPLAWFHAPSVGEGLQTRPIIEALRAERPGWQLAYSFFSPSAERLARSLPVDFADYLPLDRPRDVAAALDALAPSALIFGKLDVWPELTLAAAARGVRLGLISATVAESSSRLAWPVRRWAAPAYAALDRIGAISPEDAARLERLGARRAAITVTGDTRYDSVAQRAERLDRAREPFASLAAGGIGRFTIVAGSTWPADETVLLPAFARLRAEGERSPTRLILAPHEPTSRHLAGIEAAARNAGLPHPVPLSRLAVSTGAWDAPLVVIDQIGLLADLYALGQAAFVGGGYHRAGLHSVLEPAVFGVPVAFGPRWRMSRDAAMLIARGGAVALPSPGEAERMLADHWRLWRDDGAARDRAGAAAAAVVREGRGAASRTAALVTELLEPAALPPPLRR